MVSSTEVAMGALMSLLFMASHASASRINLTPADFEITDMPGMPSSSLNFKQYAGYMPATNGTELFFWFVTSQRDPKTDPVALWVNGGPGASSVGYGFWTEHGPFRLADNGTKVELYEYSWNKIASMVYFEAPTGVGFSWSEDPAKYAMNNDSTASRDNYEALLNFFDVFSEEFGTQDVYLTGESYGGHYVPTLAERVLDGKADGRGSKLFDRMKGFLIGNPGINSDWYFNVNEYAFQTYLWSHGLLPHKAYQASVDACGWDNFFKECETDFTHPSPKCQAANQAAYKYVPKTWDPYSVLAPTCHDDNGEADRSVTQYVPGLDALRTRYGIDTKYNPCISRMTPIYMNRPDVLKAIHAEKHYNRKWPSHPDNWSYGDEKANIALLFPNFFAGAPHWKILVVSGDADAAVPFPGTERWISCLNRDIVKDWENWMLNDDVAGSIIEYDGISFQTVKGCGHTIPTYCPEAGYAFWDMWLK